MNLHLSNKDQDFIKDAYARKLDADFLNQCSRDTDGDGDCGLHHCVCYHIRERYDLSQK
jgi:hypothetical protein